MRKALIVTLTSIPPRFGNLPRKFASIGRQKVRPDRVELYIPRQYRRFPGPVPALPALPDWVEVIRVEDDLGPATKILAAVRKWRGQPADLLLCDDDRLQDRDWTRRFAAARVTRPQDILCERGWNIDSRFGLPREAVDLPRAVLNADGGRTWGYRLRRLASLTLAHPPRQIYAQPGHTDVFEGFLGALIPADALPDAAFDIPDRLWTVDDVWLSGMARLNGVRVWAHGLARPVYSDGRADRIAALKDFVDAGIGRDAADRLCVMHFRETYGIWC